MPEKNTAKTDDFASLRNSRDFKIQVHNQIDALRLVYMALFAEDFFDPHKSRILRNSLNDCMDAMEDMVDPELRGAEARHG